MEIKESGLFDVGYLDGDPLKSDPDIFNEGTVDGTAISLPPEKGKISWYFLGADSFAGGNGTEEDPYLIATAEQLARVATEVNSGNTLKGKYLRLVADIDLSGHDWKPIGYAYFNGDNHISSGENNLSFEGVLDGDGHTVSGMNVSSRSNGSGFFSYLCGGTVKNLAIKGKVQGTNIVGGLDRKSVV